MKFSFVVPFYNVENYIEQCIRSLFIHDIPLEDFEVICVNDCSPDNSVDIVKKLQKEYSNIILVEHIENKKLGGARNTGLKYAKGEYIWFVDSDDMIKPNSLSLIVKHLDDNNLDFLHFGWDEFADNYVKKCDKIPNTDILTGTELFFDKRFVWWKNHITAWCKVYKKSFLIENNIFFAENIMYEDNDYAVKVYSSAKRSMHVSENFYLYRMNENSITRTKFNTTHIYYWLMLMQRLISLSYNLKMKKSDIRFQVALREFIKNTFWNIIKVYKGLGPSDKKIATKYIRKYIKITSIPYIRFINYLRCKISLIIFYK